MPYYVYILKSTLHERRYIGSTENLEKRLALHNKGKVRSSKAYRPYIIIYKEEFNTRSEALKQEMFFKTLDGYNYLKDKGVY